MRKHNVEFNFRQPFGQVRPKITHISNRFSSARQLFQTKLLVSRESTNLSVMLDPPNEFPLLSSHPTQYNTDDDGTKILRDSYSQQLPLMSRRLLQRINHSPTMYKITYLFESFYNMNTRVRFFRCYYSSEAHTPNPALYVGGCKNAVHFAQSSYRPT